MRAPEKSKSSTLIDLFLKNKETAAYTEPVYYDGKEIGTIEIIYSIHESVELMITQLIIYVIASIVILLLAWRFYGSMLRKTLAPLDSVIASVSEVSVDNLDEPISYRRCASGYSQTGGFD